MILCICDAHLGCHGTTVDSRETLQQRVKYALLRGLRGLRN